MPTSPDSSNVPAPSPRRRVVTARDPDPEGTARAEAASKAPFNSRKPRDVFFRGPDGMWILETDATLAALWQTIIRRNLTLGSPEGLEHKARQRAFHDARGDWQDVFDLARC